MFAWLNFTVFVDQWKCSKIIWWLGLSIGLIHRGKVLVNVRYPALVDWAEGCGRGNGWIKAGKSTCSSSPHFRVCWGSEILQPAWQGSIYEVNWGEPKCESPVLPQCWGPCCFPYRVLDPPEDASRFTQIHTPDNRAVQTLAMCNVCWLGKDVKYCELCSSWQLPPLNICSIHKVYFHNPYSHPGPQCCLISRVC